MADTNAARVPAIMATHIYNYGRCPHRVYLDAFGDRSLMDPESDFEKILWERGHVHEGKVLEHLGLSVREVEGEDFDRLAAETLSLMREGERFIYQGFITTPSMRGRPDLLERTPGESRFGRHYYVPVEIKSGSAFADEESEKMKEHYGLQLCFYADVLERLQGTRPDLGKIIDNKYRTVSFDLRSVEKDYRKALSEVGSILSKRASSEPCIGGTCKQCHWHSFCLAWARKHDDVTLIYRLNRARRDDLRAAGIKTIKDLAELAGKAERPLLAKTRPHALEPLVRRAAVMKSGKPIVHHPVEFPPAETELFFDIETEPLEEICYLYGVIEREKKGQRYVSFFADRSEDEERAWRDFWGYVARIRDYHVYHYASYERTVLTKLAERFECSPQLLEEFFGKSTDLFRVVEKHTDWPSHSYSIKLVSRCLGFGYSDADPGGLKAAKWYADYVQSPEENAPLKEKILQYNKEDCEAMIVLKDWLVEKSKRGGSGDGRGRGSSGDEAGTGSESGTGRGVGTRPSRTTRPIGTGRTVRRRSRRA
ncbi:MAG: TM0106 family RecB-like putative nuclease [Candidatus Eisenbacteria bacterium]